MNDSVLAFTLAAAVAAGTPLALAALGELITERAGILNLGVEGMMLLGAVTTFLVASATGSTALAMLAGAAAGSGAGARARGAVDQPARQPDRLRPGARDLRHGPVDLPRPAGRGGPPARRSAARTGQHPAAGGPAVPRPGAVPAGPGRLRDLGAHGGRRHLPVPHPSRLSLRAVGESPATADAMGLRVNAIRYVHTVAGGVLCGVAGAYLILARVPAWSQAATTNGIGFIAIALVVFASWRPWRALVGAYIFGLALRANFALQAAG
jgi:general nucleoside transport system permease protein